MITLNLAVPEDSNITFKINQYPDGQRDISLIGANKPHNSLTDIIPWAIREGVLIKSRCTSFRSLEVIASAVGALRRLEVTDIRLYIPYLLGARSDIQFKFGEGCYLVDVIAPFLNNLKFKTVTSLDAHSTVAQGCIHNFKSISNINFVQWAILESGIKDFVLVSPDEGSSKKIGIVAEVLEHTSPILMCNKKRDLTSGKIKTTVPFIDAPDKDFLIVDDLCDGGITFINIAREIKDNIIDRYNGKGKIYLAVTHGIFSQGIAALTPYFEKIFTTNSYTQETLSEPKYLQRMNVF